MSKNRCLSRNNTEINDRAILEDVNHHAHS